MKNLKNIFTVALIATCMSGCTGFLDIEPETTLTGKNFYKSPDDIRSALYSTYSSLRDNGLYSASIYLFGDVRSDVAFPNQTNYYANTFRHEIEKFTISANNSGNQNYWAHHYKGIIRANTVIEKGKELFALTVEYPSSWIFHKNTPIPEVICVHLQKRSIYGFSPI